MQKIVSIILTDGTIYEKPVIYSGFRVPTAEYIALSDYYSEGVLTYINKQHIKEINVEQVTNNGKYIF